MSMVSLLSSLEIKSVTQVQNLDKAVCLLRSANTLRKIMNFNHSPYNYGLIIG